MQEIGFQSSHFLEPFDYPNQVCSCEEVKFSITFGSLSRKRTKNNDDDFFFIFMIILLCLILKNLITNIVEVTNLQKLMRNQYL